MNADFVNVTRLVALGAGFLGLLAAALYLDRRVALWVRDAAPREKLRAARAVLAFFLMHGITLTAGGFAFALFLLGLRDDLPASDRADFRLFVWACFATGPALALACWASLRLLHRRLAVA